MFAVEGENVGLLRCDCALWNQGHASVCAPPCAMHRGVVRALDGRWVTGRRRRCRRRQTMAAVNVAKVDQIETEPQLKIAELQSKLQTKREELDLRERLSALTNDMRKEQSDTAAASKMAVEALRNLDTTGGTE